MKSLLTVLIILVFLINAITFAEIKTFTKETTELVPENQSQAQVIAYLTQKLTRQATEEAGVFINTEFSVKNKEITKDEFTSIAGSISKVKVEDKETFTKDNQQYVKVKVKIDVDTDSIQPYLDKIMQDNQYKREAEELRKEKLELEEKLKTATKKQYEQELSAQVQQQVELQKQRAIELNKMAIQAKEEYAKAKEVQNKKIQEREQEILNLRKQIAQEKDNIKKTELENQAKIKELELKAKENQQSWSSNKNKISIQQAIKESKKVKQETDEIINNFETLLKENKETIIKSYDEQMQLSCNTKERDQWETEEEYNVRLNKNKQVKEKLEQEKQESLYEDEIKTIKSMITTLTPFIEKLKCFQTETFYDEKCSKAQLVSIGEINVDNQYFVLNINYENEKYSLKYDFSKIGREKAKLMCQTQNQFVIEPLFSVNEYSLKAFKINGSRYEIDDFDITYSTDDSIKNICCSDFNKKAKNFYINFEYADKQYNILFDFSNIKEKKAKQMYEKAEFDIKPIFNNEENKKEIENRKQILSAFKVKHLGTKQEKILKLPITINYFDEISIFLIKKELYSFMTDKNLKKYTGIISNLENIKSKDNINRIINILDNLIIIISAGRNYHTVGLKKDGTVVAVGNNHYGKCNVEKWKDIVAISAGHSHTVGLKKDGTVVAVGDYYVEKWKDIIAVSAEEYRTVGLKKDGTVVAVGDNTFGQCNVGNWKDIVAISAGNSHTVGLTKDGTVVAVGYNASGQCNVKNWKDIVAISAGHSHTVGLKKDGTVVGVGFKNNGQCNVKNWKDIVAISAGDSHTVGLKKDGTVVAVGDNRHGQCNVGNWKDIVAISAGNSHTVGLTKDGTVVAVGGNYSGQCDVEDWSVEIPDFVHYISKADILY